MPKKTNSQPRLKIGFVFDDSLDNPDGVQQYITTLGEWFTSNGHEVKYLVGETRRDDPDIYSLARNFKIHFNKNRLSIPLLAPKEKIQRILDLERFDVLHVQLPCSPMMAGRVVKLADPRIVKVGTFHIVGHNWLTLMAAQLLSLAQEPTLARLDHIICVSKAARDFASRAFGIQECIILPNVVDSRKFRNAKPIDYLMDGQTNIVFLGRLVERKGCRYLIEAIRRLRDRGATQNLRVLILGKGPLESRLKQMVKKYNLGTIINFVGFVSEVDKTSYLASSHLAIFPSTGGESFGIVLLEAMAAQAGVVMGGDNEGYRSVLDDKYGNHVLFNPQQTQILADKIQLLLANPNLQKEIHMWQQKKVLNYDVKIIAPKLLKLYQI